MPDISDNSSPLAQADPASLDELMSRDPLEYSAQDIVQIVAHLRAHRRQWAAEEAAGAKKSKAKSPRPPKERLKLSDLDLDLKL